MKRIFSIIMEYGDLAYPRALLPSGGPLSREFSQLTTPLSVGLGHTAAATTSSMV